MPETAGPASFIEGDASKQIATRVGLCLSGGGYRAMLFHLGSLLRLTEIGYLGSQRIPTQFGRLERISSVSGGSIASATLGQHWTSVKPEEEGSSERFLRYVISPVRALARRTIDVGSVIGGLFPGSSTSKRVAASYRTHLFGNQTLDSFPDSPRFVINATNLQSGALWRFMKPYTRDWKVGEIPSDRKTIEIAVAVGASSAFPPFLSPAKLHFHEADYTPDSGGKGHNNLHFPPFTTHPVLSDGGVYDNLGLETVWKSHKTVLISDGGGQMEAEKSVPSFWPTQAFRVLNVIDNQVRSLRKREAIDSFESKTRSGAYWGIWTNIENYGLDDSLACPFDKTLKLAAISTRLKALQDPIQERLINWGYAVCDAAIRSHVDPDAHPPPNFPYPEQGVG